MKEASKAEEKLWSPFLFGVLGREASQDNYLLFRRPAFSYPESSWYSLAWKVSRISWIPLGRKSWPCRWGLGGHPGWKPNESWSQALRKFRAAVGLKWRRVHWKDLNSKGAKKDLEFLNHRCKQWKSARCVSSDQVNKKHDCRDQRSYRAVQGPVPRNLDPFFSFTVRP